MHDHFADAVDRSEGIQGNAILSKFPFVKTESFKLPVPANSKGETRSLALGVVNIEGKEVVFISVHLDHISDETRGYQVNQILGILEKYKDYPIIFTGDLNMQPESQVLKVLEKYLIIANTSLPTFPSVRPGIRQLIIFYSIKSFWTTLRLVSFLLLMRSMHQIIFL